MQAGDILLEKTPFRLTDKMIPRYWGHATIWTGHYTISPDNIAVKALDEGPLDIVILYQDGLLITDGAQQNLDHLMKPPN